MGVIDPVVRDWTERRFGGEAEELSEYDWSLAQRLLRLTQQNVNLKAHI